MFLRVSNPYCFTFICLICRAMAERCPYYQPVTSECPPAHQTLAPSHWPGLLSHRGTSNKKAASRKVEHSALCVCIGHSLLKDLKDPFWPAATVPEDTKPGCCAGVTYLQTPAILTNLSSEALPQPFSLTTTLTIIILTYLMKSLVAVNMKSAISPVTPLSSPLHHRGLSIPVLKLQSKSLLLLLPD